ncbi:MAG: hypothetical protein OES09_02765, partial [Gammaproteobacteria bacterium]|nr:hypothetical protein [Gammaproteobacteria bacterium]
GFTMNIGFATLHLNGLFWLSCWIGLHQFYQARGRFLLLVTIYRINFPCFLDLTMGEVQQHHCHTQQRLYIKQSL